MHVAFMLSSVVSGKCVCVRVRACVRCLRCLRCEISWLVRMMNCSVVCCMLVRVRMLVCTCVIV